MHGTYVGEDTDLNGKYIVWSPGSTLPPKVVYDSRPIAIKVAAMLNKKNLGERFAVCKIVGECRAVKVSYNSFSD